MDDKRFTNGGSFDIKSDLQIKMFRVSPGESIHVRTPRQVKATSIRRARRVLAVAWLTVAIAICGGVALGALAPSMAAIAPLAYALSKLNADAAR